jgi:putative membrane protein
VQHVFHRLFDVVEVRVETGGGASEEAKLSVLPRAAFDEMRRLVFAGRQQPAVPAPDTASAGPAAAPVEEAGETLVHLPLRELLLCGFLENKGLVLIGAGYGFLWESGWVGRFFEGLAGSGRFSRSLARDLAVATFDDGPWPLGRLAIAGLGLVGLLVLVRLVSMAWAFFRLYDFRVTQVREDLRIQFGLFTRVAATVPLRRIQTITLRETLLHRALGRSSVRLDTAGGTEKENVARDRAWLAPIVGRPSLPLLLARIVPGFDLDQVRWQGVHPRAFRRAMTPRLIIAGLVAAASALIIGWGAAGVLILMLVWAVLGGYLYVTNLAWAETDEVVLMRSGWFVQRVTLARVNKIQVVTTHESPFDRRAAMARVRVDTAGAGEFSHRVDIPYLPRDVAAGLAERLAVQAANTSFKW